MLACDPREIKSHVAKLKDSLDGLTSPNNDQQKENFETFIDRLSSSYCILLSTELLLRGVVVNSDKGANILPKILSEGGKALLDNDGNSGLPLPLLAGLNGFSALVAEKCANICLRDDWDKGDDQLPRNISTAILFRTNYTDLNDLSEKLFNDTIARCKEVKDDRILSLLTISQKIGARIKELIQMRDDELKHNNNNSSSSNIDIPANLRKLLVQSRRYFLVISKNQFLRTAIHFMPNKPVMWKQCLDSVLALDSSVHKEVLFQQESTLSQNIITEMLEVVEYRKYYTQDAILPLQNLARIAKDKGNMRRVSELNLYLAASFLAFEMVESGDTSSKIASDEMMTLCNSAFNAQHRKIQSSSVVSTLEEASSKSSQALKEFHLNLFSDTTVENNLNNVLLYHVLCLSSELAMEKSVIQKLASERFTKATNRVAESISSGSRKGKSGVVKKGIDNMLGGTKTLEEEPFHDEARSEVLLKYFGGKTDSAAKKLHEVTVQIIDDLVKLSSEDGLDNIVMHAEVLSSRGIQLGNVMAAMDLLKENLLRLVERAQSRSLLQSSSPKQAAEKSSFMELSVPELWLEVSHFAASILRVMGRTSICNSNYRSFFLLNSSANGLIDICAKSILKVDWMVEHIACNDSNILEVVLASTDIVMATSALKQINEMNSNERDTKKTFTQSKRQIFPGSSDIALASGSCRTLFLNVVGDEAKQIDKICKGAHVAALKMNKKSILSIQSEFGTAFMQSLQAWCGLLRNQPWPFSTVVQAREMLEYSRSLLLSSMKNWGRKISKLEEKLLDIAEADAEGFLAGGRLVRAREIYSNVVSELDESSNISLLLVAHCRCGLAGTSLLYPDDEPGDGLLRTAAEKNAREALNIVTSLKSALDKKTDIFVNIPPFLRLIFLKSISSINCNSRQLVANCLVRASRYEDAKVFLEKAVQDSPSNFDAVFALGAFRLRQTLSLKNIPLKSAVFSSADKKFACAQLLEAAKIDSHHAGPFALLGYWYEVQNVIKRSIGCYSKALAINPTHPVAGRGLLRVLPLEKARTLCEIAASTISPINGWAWRGLGRISFIEDEDDTVASSLFQEALRCRDIESPKGEYLSFFFLDPRNSYEISNFDDINQSNGVTCNEEKLLYECGKVWSELAGCYRRLDKRSAAVMAYNRCYEVSGNIMSNSDCSSWAQVELELGCFDEALVLFDRVLRFDTSNGMAAYGRASCLLAFAKRSAAEGKSGLAYNELLQGISCILDNLVSEEISLDGSLLSYSSEFGCALKLLGDLFSLGAILPPDVFKSKREKLSSQKENIAENEVRNNLYDEQIAFVAKGEAAYETSSSLISAQLLGDEERIATAAIACDLGTNHLLQARLLSSSFTEGSGGLTQTSLNDMSKISEIEDKLKKSSNSFRAAISANEVVAPAWCGLGCALSGTDPLLAQHCFSRSIELDGTFPDAWANLGLLYAERGAQVACDLALDGLTQVADTPLMWICRGLILETKSSVMSQSHDSDFLKAADAYRAALQVSNHPSALLGLALTCRRLGIDSETSYVGPGEKYTEAAKAMAMTESMVNMDLYQSQTGGSNVGSTVVKGLLAIEESIKRAGLAGVELFQDGKQNLLRAKKTFAMLRSEKPDDEMISCDLALKSTYPDDCMPFSDASSAIDATFFTVSYDPATNEHESDRFTNIALNALDAAQRKLHENPDNGFYWFCLAKEYIVFVNSHKKAGLSDSQMYATMQNAMIAVTKAEMLLQRELVHVSLLTATRPLNNFVENNKGSQRNTSVAHKPSIPESLSCSLMADALSLKYLIYKLGIMQTSKMWDDNNIDCGLESSAKIAIQKSIMIDPENSIARAGFDLMLNNK